MASLASTTLITFHLLLFLLLSLAIQSHGARESKFFTKLIHYLSDSPRIASSPSSSPAPAPLLITGLVHTPLLAPGLAPVPAPGPVEKEYGYGLYGQGSSEYSSEEYHTSTLDQGLKNEIPAEEKKWSPPFEKLLGSNNNGYSNNEKNVYYSNDQNNIGGLKNNDNYGYSNNYNDDNGYRFSSSMNGYTNDRYNNMNGYTTTDDSYNNQNNNGNMRFENENNGNEFTSLKEENNNNNNAYNNNNNNNNNAYNNNNNNNGYVKGLSDTRYLENGNKYWFDANNNQETSYEELEGNDNGYYNRNTNEKSKYEFDTMEEYERYQGYNPSGYVP